MQSLTRATALVDLDRVRVIDLFEGKSAVTDPTPLKPEEPLW
jgi:hypothetical protein